MGFDGSWLIMVIGAIIAPLLLLLLVLNFLRCVGLEDLADRIYDRSAHIISGDFLREDVPRKSGG